MLSDTDPLVLGVTAPDAAEVLASHARARGGYDVVVHNAGITRDKTLARMARLGFAYHSIGRPPACES